MGVCVVVVCLSVCLSCLCVSSCGPSLFLHVFMSISVPRCWCPSLLRATLYQFFVVHFVRFVFFFWCVLTHTRYALQPSGKPVERLGRRARTPGAPVDWRRVGRNHRRGSHTTLAAADYVDWQNSGSGGRQAHRVEEGGVRAGLQNAVHQPGGSSSSGGSCCQSCTRQQLSRRFLGRGGVLFLVFVICVDNDTCACVPAPTVWL